MKHIGADATGDRPPTNIDRRTFRRVLLTGITEIVNHERELADVAPGDTWVTVTFTDGSTAAGDVLVAADGVGSAVRRRLMPDVQIVPAPVGALGLFGRAPLPDGLESELPAAIWDAGFAIVSDGSGVQMGVGHWRPRQPASLAAAELGLPWVEADAAPYVMLNGAIPPGMEIPPPPEWTAGTPQRMHEAMVAAVSEWHPTLRRLVETIDRATLFSHPFRRLDPPVPWPTSRVTYVGDSIHAMLPTLGKGANMAMRNAAVLHERLVAAARGEEPLLEAIATYEADMREATYPLMALASDHDNFGGGALRGPGEAGADA